MRLRPFLVIGICATLAAVSVAPSAAQSDRVGVNPPVTVVDESETTTTIPTTTTTTSTTTTSTTTTAAATITVTAPSTSTSSTPPSTTPGGAVVTTVPGGTTTIVTTTPSSPADATSTIVPVPVIDANPTTTIAGPPTVPAKVSVTTTSKPKAATVTPARTVAEIRERMDAILRDVPGVVGAVSADGLGLVYERNSDKGVVPASTQKIYSIGTALVRLGGDMRFVTEVRSSTLVSGGVLNGDLVVRGSGDPSLSGNGISALADAVVKSGIKQVVGDLVVDESHFDSQRTNDGWKPSFMPGEVGSLSAFTVNGNRHGGKAALDPAVSNLGLLRASLKQRGVVVSGIDRRGVLPLGGPVLGSVTSAPLRDLAASALKKSDNTYAELLLKELGASAGNGSTTGGLELVRQQFAAFGVATPVMADGSGLSSLNRSTPRQQIGWLSKMRAGNSAADFRNALPVACVDGTLKSRFCRTAAAGKVQAKTGTLDNVTALSGYGSLPSGRAVVFSFIGNALPSSSRARAAIDQALLVVFTSTVS